MTSEKTMPTKTRKRPAKPKPRAAELQRLIVRLGVIQQGLEDVIHGVEFLPYIEATGRLQGGSIEQELCFVAGYMQDTMNAIVRDFVAASTTNTTSKGTR